MRPSSRGKAVSANHKGIRSRAGCISLPALASKSAGQVRAMPGFPGETGGASQGQCVLAPSRASFAKHNHASDPKLGMLFTSRSIFSEKLACVPTT
jgi:hypothetical protein